MNEQNYKVLSKIISAVETGGQVYGQGRYDDYTPPYKNTPNEHTITLGWAQNYGYEAKQLIKRIFDKDKSAFRKLDTCTPSIESMLGTDWVATRWNPSSSQKSVLIKLISSNIGRDCQDELFAELMKKFVTDCESTYTKKVSVVMMYCEIRHLGGKTAADRIFKRCNGNYSLDSIMSALKKDQYDTSSSNQVGDKKFWSRHQKCVEFINKYAVSESGNEVKPVASALSRAKTLLRQPQGDVMTGYTPDGKSYFVAAKQWYSTPQKGDVIYFYSTSKGRVGHVGMVEKVDSANKIVHTIEGNTSSTEYAENGGCVARHSYSYKYQGGTNRVNGFGRPNFAGAGVTADQFVATGVSFLGYLEKRSNSQLDSKTANAGSNNYQRFQRDVGAGNGDQWCQFWIDAMALYTCQGVSGGTTEQTEHTLNESAKWTGYVDVDLLNVRTWAGVDNYLCSFSPLTEGTAVGVCDTVKADNGDDWYYILYNDKHGFVSAKYISKTKHTEEAPAPTTSTAPKVKDTTFSTTKLKRMSSAKVMTATVKDVADTARKSGWTYGDSHSQIPCDDSKISCDRLEARALYQMGFRDQRTGGETCGTLDAYLTSNGWTKVMSKSDVKAGSIVAVRKTSHNYIDHVFYVASYNKTKDTCTKYDTGSNERIKTVQPFKNVPLVEWSDRVFVCAWNPPSWICTGTVGKYVYDGVDYSPVFNAVYYRKMYPDVAKACGTNRKKLFNHFVEYGMKEGRQGCAYFNVNAYKTRYTELKKTYGKDLPSYYKHFCQYGYQEGRIGN